jgi:hypothetical protein
MVTIVTLSSPPATKWEQKAAPAHVTRLQLTMTKVLVINVSKYYGC